MLAAVVGDDLRWEGRVSVNRAFRVTPLALAMSLMWYFSYCGRSAVKCFPSTRSLGGLKRHPRALPSHLAASVYWQRHLSSPSLPTKPNLLPSVDSRTKEKCIKTWRDPIHYTLR
jgi:hypothetical protein